jgi:hypothetical protein
LDEVTVEVSIARVGEALGLGQAVGFEDVGSDSPLIWRLRRITEKVSAKLISELGFDGAVQAAEQAVSDEGGRALFGSLVQCQKIEAPVEREYKIKRVPKGQRIQMVSESGIRFSFGPVWNEAVCAMKGIALNTANREKLNMHGTYLGVENPDKMTARELCTAIAERME